MVLPTPIPKSGVSRKNAPSPRASSVIPPWAGRLHEEHWDKQGRVPQKSRTHARIKVDYIAKSALARPLQHPIMIRPTYVEILRKLEENLDKEKLKNVLEDIEDQLDDDDQTDSDDDESLTNADTSIGLNADKPTDADYEMYSDARTDVATAGTDIDETDTDVDGAEFDNETDVIETDTGINGVETDAGTGWDPESEIKTNFVPENTRNGLYIFGHPGSGKSTCLHYLLIAMLRRGQPVLWVEHTVKRMILFKEDSATFYSLHDLATLANENMPLVILWDAQAGPIPSHLFGNVEAHYHLVLATSPQVNKFKDWQQNGIECITMKPCSRQEVIWLAIERPERFSKTADYHGVMTVYDYLGPSLKTLKDAWVPIRDGTTTTEDFTAYCSDIIKDMPRVPKDTLANLRSDQESDLYHRIFSVTPALEDGVTPKWHRSPTYRVSMITPFMAILFFATLDFKDFVELAMYAGQSLHAGAVRAALFERQSIRFLSWSQTVSRIAMASGEKDVIVPTVLPTAEKYLELVPSQPPAAGVLHVARINAPTIDALYQAKNGTTLLFQMTVADKHDIAEKGLKEILACFSTEPKPVGPENFILVFVVPDVQTQAAYLSRYVNGYDVTMKRHTQNLRVGVLVINTSNILLLDELVEKHKRSAKILVREGETYELPRAVRMSKDLTSNIRRRRKSNMRNLKKNSRQGPSRKAKAKSHSSSQF